MASATAVVCATPIDSRPAPTRRLASPASIAAPGVAAAPPRTTTCPRPYLLFPGAGSAHSRRDAGVTRSGIGVSGMLGDGCLAGLQMGHVVERHEVPAAGLGSEPREGDV